MKYDIDEDGLFDGALLIDGRGYRTIEMIENLLHRENRLSLIIRKPSHYIVEYLLKHKPEGWSEPIWGEAIPSSIVESIEEAEALANQYLKS